MASYNQSGELTTEALRQRFAIHIAAAIVAAPDSAVASFISMQRSAGGQDPADIFVSRVWELATLLADGEGGS